MKVVTARTRSDLESQRCLIIGRFCRRCPTVLLGISAHGDVAGGVQLDVPSGQDHSAQDLCVPVRLVAEPGVAKASLMLSRLRAVAAALVAGFMRRGVV